MLLAETLDLRDVGTARHSETVGGYAEQIARGSTWTPRGSRGCGRGYLHDIGKLGVSDAVLHKRGGLDAAEWEEIAATGRSARGSSSTAGSRHRRVGARHHERGDGAATRGGSPGGDPPRVAHPRRRRRLRGDDRRPALPPRAARPPSPAGSWRTAPGTQFDAEVVAAFVAILDPPPGRMELGEPAPASRDRAPGRAHAGAPRPLALRQLGRGLRDRRPGVAALLEPLAHRAQRVHARPQRLVLELLPGERGGDRRARDGAEPRRAPRSSARTCCARCRGGSARSRFSLRQNVVSPAPGASRTRSSAISPARARTRSAWWRRRSGATTWMPREPEVIAYGVSPSSRSRSPSSSAPGADRGEVGRRGPRRAGRGRRRCGPGSRGGRRGWATRAG